MHKWPKHERTAQGGQTPLHGLFPGRTLLLREMAFLPLTPSPD